MKKKPEPIAFELDRKGIPVLPDFDPEEMPSLGQQKDFIRAYLTSHYREFNFSTKGKYDKILNF
jgi:hypothetical protein